MFCNVSKISFELYDITEIVFKNIANESFGQEYC